MRNLLLSAASVGIIGGADGPTSIFIAAAPDWPVYAIGVAVVILAITLILRKKRKK